jgi:hypothetical protein
MGKFTVDASYLIRLESALRSMEKFVPNALEKAVYEEGSYILMESQKIVPVDTGALRASGNIKPPVRLGNSVHVDIGYGNTSASYAFIVHENLTNRHASPTQAKYLEVPILRQLPIFIKNISIRLKHIVLSSVKQ